MQKRETLNVYTGPFVNEEIEISIIEKKTNNVLFRERGNPCKKTGNIKINLSHQNFSDGIYTCEMSVSENKFRQDFFYGNIDHYFGSLKQEYKKIEFLTKQQQLNIEGIIKRVYINARRDSTDFDDQVEYWNRIRIPSLVQLEHAIDQLKHKEEPLSEYFLRGYYSVTWNDYGYYSAYLPPKYKKAHSIPLFIFLIDSEIPVRDWSDHWRNSVANGLLEIIDMAEELGFIAVWTDCGGKISLHDQLMIFEEILHNVCNDLPVELDKIFLIGNCASTNIALNILNKFPEQISGCGFINPKNIDSKYFVDNNRRFQHTLTMIYAEHDEVILKSSSLSLFEKLKYIDSKATIYKCSLSSHYNSPANYVKPLFIDLLHRVR